MTNMVVATTPTGTAVSTMLGETATPRIPPHRHQPLRKRLVQVVEHRAFRMPAIAVSADRLSTVVAAQDAKPNSHPARSSVQPAASLLVLDSKPLPKCSATFYTITLSFNCSLLGCAWSRPFWGFTFLSE